MASNLSIARCMRTSPSISRLANSLRALYLSPSASRPTTAAPVSLRLQTDTCQARSLSSSIAPKCCLSVGTRPVVKPLAMTTLQQQTRGMKVHSSIKKRCEHCKVRIHAGSHRLMTWIWDLMADWDNTDRSAEEGQERERVPIRHLQRKSQAQTTPRIMSDNKMSRITAVAVAVAVAVAMALGMERRQVDKSMVVCEPRTGRSVGWGSRLHAH